MKNIYTLANIKKVKWGVLEENKPISLFPVMYPGWCGIIKSTGKILGKYQKSIISLHRKDSGWIFVDHKEWTSLGQHTLNKILKSTRWGLELNKKILQYSDELVNYSSDKIFKTNLKKKSNLVLYNLYKGFSRRHSQLYNHAIIPVYLDLYKPHLTSYLVEYLSERVGKAKYQKTAKECFVQLTVTERISKVLYEELALFKLAIQVRKKYRNKPISKKIISSSLNKKIETHIKKYKYLGYNFEGPAFPDKYFWGRLREFVKADVEPEARRRTMMREKAKSHRDYQKIVKDLKIDHRHQQLIKITQGFIFSKDYRKMSLVRSYYEIEPLLREIGKRVDLSLAEVRNCLLDEVGLMLNSEYKRPPNLTKRMKGSMFVLIKRKFPARVFVGKMYSIMFKCLMKKEDLTEVNYFHGQAACLGKARGRVKIINTMRDLPKMKTGNIMVSQMTNPDLVPAMKKAVAIVTDLGGVTCHAAIISRELKIPCVIGTKIATQALKDGDEVDVNANRGDIRKI